MFYMMGKKGIDEFVYVLLAGLLMIIVMLFAWGIPPSPPEGNVSVVTSGAFAVGASPQDVPRHVKIGDFSVSYAVGSKILVEKENIEVRKGLTVNEYERMSASIDEDLDLVTSGFFSVYVLDTNSEGKLVLKVNNEVVFNQKIEPGSIDVPVDKDLLKGYNVIEVSTSSPGWKFWTSSVYKIEKMEFGINFFGNLEKSEVFEVYESELRTFKEGKVEFEVGKYSGEGDLMIRINDREIYKGRPLGMFSQSFDIFDVGLAKGMNSITFSAESGASYEIEDCELIIIHEEAGQKSRSFSFNVDSSQYNKLKSKNGGIKFYVVESNCLGSLQVKITDTEGDKNLVQELEICPAGRYRTVSFDVSYVGIGTNYVTFEASGDGSFVLSNVEINV